ncbi:unnamed protein product [Adineta steineri]|uniref:C-type lectin domain-containing protein n=1 Tax=Adineta steineri TaxID=433720 RepID=A0A815Q2X0_9BILA|nr:unnamed protein product [Adineta steineri]CAF3932859.1 unnamed protein product [Adineta steineri]
MIIYHTFGYMNVYVYFFLIIIYETTTTIALSYNDACTNKCDIPGMVCENNQCKCSSKSRLFWTGARCTPCPNDWTMTETECIGLYETFFSRENAKSICANHKANLISFRHQNILPLIYNITSKSTLSLNKGLRVWTSASAVHLNGFGLYEWLDKTQNTFTSASNWWCKKDSFIGYEYIYNEPTRFNHTGAEEECVAYWIGLTKDAISTETVCLDDQRCDSMFPFMCEKTESTALQYIGPAQKSNKTTIIIIIIGIIFLILLALALTCGFIFFRKRRNTIKIQNNDANVLESIQSPRKTIEDDRIFNNPTVPNNIVVKQQQANKRAGYNKQQFDEFD